MLFIDKPKLPKGRAYVLKTSLLESALPPDSVDCDISLSYWTPKAGASIFEVEYWLPNERRRATLFIRAASVPASDASEARAQLTNDVLPRFARWARDILALPADAPLLHRKPRFVATYVAGVVDVTADQP